MADLPITRLIVVPIIKDSEDRVLLCVMPPDRGVFPNQWGLPGGGVEPGERIDEALKRDVMEELGVVITVLRPLFFKDGLHEKTFPDGEKRLVYMVFLLYECRVDSNQPIRLNAEFSQYSWVQRDRLGDYDLNSATRDTFSALGLIRRDLNPLKDTK